MSDPVTNVEIEDVLSSIRKLVSEGEQARVRDSAPDAPDAPDAPEAAAVEASDEQAPESKPAKLVLTPAFMVSVGADAAEAETPHSPALSEIVWEETDAPAEDEADAPVEEVAEEDQPAEEVAHGTDTRRSALEATIAELEASVAVEGFEPDGSEEVETVEAMIWPGHHRRPHEEAEDAALVDDTPQETTPPADAAEEADADSAAFDENDPFADEAFSDDEDLGAFLDDAASLDEQALRELVAEIVREELQGVLGERITRNVRKLVRREIYRILSSQDFE